MCHWTLVFKTLLVYECSVPDVNADQGVVRKFCDILCILFWADLEQEFIQRKNKTPHADVTLQDEVYWSERSVSNFCMGS